MEFIHLSQIIQEVYNDFKRELNQDFLAGYTILPYIRQNEIKPGQPDRTPLCRSKREKQAQTKLL